MSLAVTRPRSARWWLHATIAGLAMARLIGMLPSIPVVANVPTFWRAAEIAVGVLASFSLILVPMLADAWIRAKQKKCTDAVREARESGDDEPLVVAMASSSRWERRCNSVWQVIMPPLWLLLAAAPVLALVAYDLPEFQRSNTLPMRELTVMSHALFPLVLYRLLGHHSDYLRRIDEARPLVTDGAPGASIAAVLDFLYSKKTFEAVFVPAIADMREEHGQALMAGRKIKSKWVLIRGYYSIVVAAFYKTPLGKFIGAVVDIVTCRR